LNPLFGQEINLIWEMPDIVCSAATYGTNYTACERYREQCAVVSAASGLAAASLSGEPLEGLLTDAVFAELNLYQDSLCALVEKRDKIVAAVRTQVL